MLKIYFERTRCEKGAADELETLASKLSISESVEEVLQEMLMFTYFADFIVKQVDEVQGMLQYFTSLSLKKKAPATSSTNSTIAQISSLSITDQT